MRVWIFNTSEEWVFFAPLNHQYKWGMSLLCTSESSDFMALYKCIIYVYLFNFFCNGLACSNILHYWRRSIVYNFRWIVYVECSVVIYLCIGCIELFLIHELTPFLLDITISDKLKDIEWVELVLILSHGNAAVDVVLLSQQSAAGW